jgi:protein TonB
MVRSNQPATRVSENRFLQSFFAVSASAVLVSGTLLLLSSTAPWNPPQLADGDPSTPDATSRLPETTAAIDIALPRASLASDQADFTDSTEPDMAAKAGPEEPSLPALPEASFPEVEAVAALGTPLSPESADVSLEGSLDMSITADAASNVGASGVPAEVAVAVPLAEVAELRRDTATDQIAEMLTALPPRPIASDKSDAATGEVATALAAEPPAPTPPPATEAAAVKVATALASSPPAPAPVPADESTAFPKVAEMVGPPPPLPRRKPAVPQPEPKAAVVTAEPQAAPAKQELARQDVVPPKQDAAPAPQATEQPRSGFGPWHAMALAPADQPVLKVPTGRPNSAAYGSQVWAALARHKPRAGVRGSATVVFSIGENGGLRGVKLGRSSGNQRIDQLALQTVRSAAPYPPPPAGVATYTIRVDFQ